MKTLYRIWFLLLIMSIGACSHSSEFIRKQRDIFEELCNAEDRSIIYKTAKVGGYLILASNTNTCSSAWDPLLYGEYYYVECSLEYTEGKMIKNLTDFYKTTIQKEGGSSCSIQDEKLELYQQRNHEKHKDELIGKCLGANKINFPSSTYAILYDSGYIDGEQEHKVASSKNYNDLKRKEGLIRYWGYRVTNIKNGDVLAIDRDYKFYPGGLVNDFAKQYECAEDPYINIKEILIPTDR